MATLQLVIHLTLGEPRTGIWCDDCMTSGAFEVDVLRLKDDGVQVVGTARRCITCREHQTG